MTGAAVILFIFNVFFVNVLYGITFKIMTVITEITLRFFQWSTCAMTICTGISKTSHMSIMDIDTIIALQIMT